MRKITDYDKIRLLTQSDSLKQKKYYEIQKNDNKCVVSLIDGLNKSHFSDELYSGVKEGSKRWWVLERRKFDYNKFKSRNNHKIFTNKDIETNESEWEKKVNDFYSMIEYGYVEHSSIGKETKSPSKYMLNKHYDDERKLTFDEVRKIGLDEDNKPLYYRIVIDEDGNEVDVICNVKLDNIKFELNCKKFTERWWVLKRMKFDFGNQYQPLIKGEEKGDWKGVEYKFNYLYKNENRSFQVYHEESWNRYIDSLEQYLQEDHTEISQQDKIRHNSEVLSVMDEEKFNRMILDYPNLIIQNTPTEFYQTILIYMIDKLVKDKRFIPLYGKAVEEVVRPFKNLIKNFIHVDYECCDRITMRDLKSLVFYHQNEIYGFIRFFIYSSVQKGMVRVQYVNTLLGYMEKFKVTDIEIGNNSQSIEEQLKIYDVNNSFMDRFEEIEKSYESFCHENDLYNI